MLAETPPAAAEHIPVLCFSEGSDSLSRPSEQAAKGVTFDACRNATCGGGAHPCAQRGKRLLLPQHRLDAAHGLANAALVLDEGEAHVAVAVLAKADAW